MSHFDRLGLPQTFDIDSARLEAAYLAACRAAHPDHAGSPEVAALVNAAYTTLRDPILRAVHLLGLLGGSVPTQLDSAFLMETIELRERAETAGGEAVGRELDARLTSLFDDLTEQFAADDVAGAGRTLATAKTLRSLRSEVVG